MPAQNLATIYAKEVDERFTRESQATLALNDNYKFTGAKTVKVYSIPTVPMKDYSRSGMNRYGTPTDLATNIQTLTVTRDRGYTFIIDKGDDTQSMKVLNAGKALARQIREVVVPEFDTYCFAKLASEAVARGNFSTEKITKSNAFEMFLKAQEHLGNHNVPDKGRVAFCSYGFASYLMLDPAFVKQGDASQELVQRGVIGTVDGTRIVRVPSSRLPAGCAFLLTHPIAATAPKVLDEYKIHDNPPGISGSLVEGRFLYDCFVLNEKADAIYYHGSQEVLKVLNLTTVGYTTGKSTILTEPADPENGNKRYCESAPSAEELTAVTYGTAITPGNWTALTSNGQEITPDSGDKVAAVVEVDASNKPVAYGRAVLNIG